MRLRGWRVTDTRVVPAAVGLPRQSPARQLVVAQLSHRVRRKLPPLVIINAHWPRNADVLASRREAVMRVARRVVAQHYKRGRTVLFTCDSNGYDMRKLHPRARRIGGAGIDWIGVVEPPRGARINVKSRGSIDLTIDGHNAHWVRFRVSKR